MKSSDFQAVELPPLNRKKGTAQLDPRKLLSVSEREELRGTLDELVRKRRQSAAKANTLRLS